MPRNPNETDTMEGIPQFLDEGRTSGSVSVFKIGQVDKGNGAS